MMKSSSSLIKYFTSGLRLSLSIGNELTQLTKDAFRENAAISEKVEQLLDETVAASQEQAQGIGQVNVAMTV